MAILESTIEEKLIEQLCKGDSQWTYRPDLNTEEKLWDNFRQILTNNNKDILNDKPLTDQEFEQVKNALDFSTFYAAAEWLVGENGIAHVSVQRDIETVQLRVINRAHKSGGSSVYEVINQYQTFKDTENDIHDDGRRFDVTLMINGIPLIHIELKNQNHSYMEGFNQIKKYVAEGRFTGIFSMVQMFVVSNSIDTKYIASAREGLNEKFLSGWCDDKNERVSRLNEFAGFVLRIPEAHEMVTQYSVLDSKAKKLILLRPYQIHAIERIREASKKGQSGYIWHTTGSGKTLTSYKVARNLLQDIPSIEKTIFLIDRKDLDQQTTLAFQSYADADIVDVENTDSVADLLKKLSGNDQTMIVTTIQKLQIVIKWLNREKDKPRYKRIRDLRLAFVVDECHRAVSPQTQREIARFFTKSLWYGFTGTPRFKENPYPMMGDLPRTTDTLYGPCLHMYTVKDAIRDKAVLGFQVEHLGPANLDEDNEDLELYEKEDHMLEVLNVIINKSANKLGFANGRGRTYEAMLTTSSIKQAQAYYELLRKVVAGETRLKISEEIKKQLSDFPKFAITYSVAENKDGSMANAEKMQVALDDYNKMFSKHFDVTQIDSYNAELTDRLARKQSMYQSRQEQLDLVIVVDRMLTGFDAPCLSTLFIDRQPLQPHSLIQAFSRTNRLKDKRKTAGQIVTFQSPNTYKKDIDDALILFSNGGDPKTIIPDWDDIEVEFKISLSRVRQIAQDPADISGTSRKKKIVFVKAFREFDRAYAQLKSFVKFEEKDLERDYGLTEQDYFDYNGVYKNVLDELRIDDPNPNKEDIEHIDPSEYELMAYGSENIDYEYIVALMQDLVTSEYDLLTLERREKHIKEIADYIDAMASTNPKLGEIMRILFNDMLKHPEEYRDKQISAIIEHMRHDAILNLIETFSKKWYLNPKDIEYAAYHYKSGSGDIPNSGAIKDSSDYTAYRDNTENPEKKFRYRKAFTAELKDLLENEIVPLRDTL